MDDARVLGHRQVGAERQLLEDAADARGAGPRRDAVAGGRVRAVDPMIARVRRQRAGQHVHQRRLAGAVVADQADALAGADARGRPRRARGRRRSSSRRRRGDDRLSIAIGGIGSAGHAVPLTSPAMTLLRVLERVLAWRRRRARCVGEVASRLSWSMRRYGTTRSCGTSLPARICCATQKARVETPGAIETDIVS